jgi:hypothetical protein
LWCGFTLRNITTIPTPLNLKKFKGIGRKLKIYDQDRQYFLQLAKGPVSIPPKGIKLHGHEDRMRTLSTVDFNQLSAEPIAGMDLSGDKRQRIIKVHAILMVIAWMFFAEIGTFTAGYFRTRFPENAGVYWFHIHQLSMCITLILSVVSATLMFIAIGSHPLGLERLKINPHALFGLLALIITCVQPIMGFLRPGPYSNRRPLFNNVHKYLGYFATVLALTAIIFTAFLTNASLSEYTVIGPVSFVVCYIAAHFFLKKVKDIGMTFFVTFGYFCGIAGMFLLMIAYLSVIIFL